MAHRSAGTLALPWSQTSQRSGQQRVAADHTLLAVTMILALVGLVMVFSASAIVAGNRFQDPGFFLKRQIAWLAFGFLLMHLTSRIDYTLWKKLSIPMLALHVAAARHGAGAVDRCGGQGGAAMVAVGAHLGSAGGNGQARGGHLYRGVSDQKRGQDHVVSRWSSAGPDRDRTVERTGVARAGSWDGRGARTGDSRDVFSRRGAHLPSLGLRPLRDSGRAGAGSWVQLSTPTAHDVSCSMEGCVGCRVSNHAILLGLRQRRSVRGGIGRGQTEALFSPGGAYRFCPGAGRRRTGTHRDRHRDPAVCDFLSGGGFRSLRARGCRSAAIWAWALPC